MAGFLILAIFLIFNFESITPAEYQIIMIVITLFVSFRSYPQLFQIVKRENTSELKLNQSKTFELFHEVLKTLKFKAIDKQEPKLSKGILRSSYGVEFVVEMDFQAINSTTRIKYSLYGGPGTVNRLGILFLLTIYPLIAAVSQETFNISIPIFNITVNAEYLFAIFFILMLLFGLIQSSVAENILYYIETEPKNLLVDFALRSQKSGAELGVGISKPDLKFSTEEARKKAERIRDIQAKNALEERRKKLKSRVDGVLGDSKEEDKNIDPELLRTKILISKVKKVLQFTSITKKITLSQISKHVKHKDNDEIEKIIMGLIDRKEITGQYDIWDKTFQSGEISSIFVEKTLETLKLSREDIEYIRINRGGNVEIGFAGDHISQEDGDLKLGSKQNGKNIRKKSKTIKSKTKKLEDK